MFRILSDWIIENLKSLFLKIIRICTGGNIAGDDDTTDKIIFNRKPSVFFKLSSGILISDVDAETSCYLIFSHGSYYL